METAIYIVIFFFAFKIMFGLSAVLGVTSVALFGERHPFTASLFGVGSLSLACGSLVFMGKCVHLLCVVAGFTAP